MYKKLMLSAGVLGVFGLYAYHLKTDVEEHPVIAIRNPVTSATPLNIPTPNATGPSPIPTPSSTPKAKFKDGTFTGPVTDAFYGNIEVQAVITNGKISDVIFLQYPNDRRTSVEINTQAMPLLKQEAIQAQSSKVDGVSGATQTSDAFIKSLESALNKAV